MALDYDVKQFLKLIVSGNTEYEDLEEIAADLLFEHENADEYECKGGVRSQLSGILAAYNCDRNPKPPMYGIELVTQHKEKSTGWDTCTYVRVFNDHISDYLHLSEDIPDLKSLLQDLIEHDFKAEEDDDGYECL